MVSRWILKWGKEGVQNDPQASGLDQEFRRKRRNSEGGAEALVWKGEVKERDNKSKLASDDSALKFHGRSHLMLISLHPEGRDGK